MIELPAGVETRMAMVDNRAVVIAIGDAAWDDEGRWERFLFFFRRWVSIARAKIGDKVLVTKFAGFMAEGPADGKQYRLVNDRDIFCAITNEGGENG